VEVPGIFENLADNAEQSAFSKIGDRLNKKKGLRQPFDSPFELHFAFVCNKSAMGGGGLAEGHRQRAAEIARIADIAEIGKPNPYH
jgi:hypothetical protein